MTNVISCALTSRGQETHLEVTYEWEGPSNGKQIGTCRHCGDPICRYMPEAGDFEITRIVETFDETEVDLTSPHGRTFQQKALTLLIRGHRMVGCGTPNCPNEGMSRKERDDVEVYILNADYGGEDAGILLNINVSDINDSDLKESNDLPEVDS